MQNRNLNNFLFVMVLGTAIGALYGYLVEDLVVYGLGVKALFIGALRGAAVVICALWLSFLVSSTPVESWLRMLPFSQAVVLRSLLLTLVLLLALVTSHLGLTMLFIEDKGLYLQWLQGSMVRDFFVAAATGFVIQILLQARRLIGARTLRNFVFGRYARPIREKRIFVLGDMMASTEMAEKLGDERALELISRFYLDIDPAISKHGGEIHNYIGDEVVLSWPLREPRSNAAVIACIHDMQTIIAARWPFYLKSFGVAPDMRFGVAGGFVAVGECGWEKRQVLHIGDTINTAKRLQEHCKITGDRVLIDAETAGHIRLPSKLFWRDAGETQLRGRSGTTQLMSFTR